MEKKKVLIIKREAKAIRALDVERWIRKVLEKRIVKIIRAASNKDAAKVFFVSEKKKDDVWEKRDYLRNEEDMYIDRWLTIEERKERYKLMERTSSLREEYRRKGFKLIAKMEGGKRKEEGDRR